MIIGFDASTSTIGWCVLDSDKKFVDIGHIDLKKEKDLYNKLSVFSLELDRLVKKYNPKIIAIEEPVMRFGNASSAYVIAILQRFNGMVSSEVFRKTGHKPVLVNALHARKNFGLKIPKGTKAKEFIFAELNARKLIPESFWKYKKTGKPKDFCFDMSDAYIVAYSSDACK